MNDVLDDFFLFQLSEKADSLDIAELPASAFCIKLTVHLERCLQFSICNSVNTHRTPTNLSINGKLMNYLNDGVKII